MFGAVVCRKYTLEPSNFRGRTDRATVYVFVPLKKRKTAAGATPASILC